RPQPGHPGGDEGRRGPPRRQRRTGRRPDPAAAGPDPHGRRLPPHEDGRLPPVGAVLDRERAQGALPQAAVASDSGPLYNSPPTSLYRAVEHRTGLPPALAARQGNPAPAMQSFSAKNAPAQPDWYRVHAEGKTLGRLATE